MPKRLEELKRQIAEQEAMIEAINPSSQTNIQKKENELQELADKWGLPLPEPKVPKKREMKPNTYYTVSEKDGKAQGEA